MRTTIRGGRLTAAVSALALGVTTIATAGAATALRGDATGATVDVFIERDRTVHIDQTLQPGVHRFVVRSERPSGFQLIRPDAGYTKREAIQDLMGGFQGDMRKLRRAERNLTLLGGVNSALEEPGVMWAELEPGTYWALDSFDGTWTPQETITVQVTGSRTAGTVPGGPVLRAVGAVDWTAKPANIPASGRLTFRNDSTENHFLGLAKLLPGKTMADFEAWIEAGAEGRPPVDWDTGLETGAVSGGESMSLRYDLPPGRYVMVCWWPDASMDGMPHVLMGMYRGIRVG